MINEIIGAVDFINLFLAALTVASIYTAVDGFSRLGVLSGENGRKAIHISVGVWAATFPLFMNRTEIFVFHGMFFVGIVSLSIASDFVRNYHIAQQYRIGRFMASLFERYEDVSRWTIGQFLYPLSLMLVVFIYDDLAVYSFAVLLLALGDGFAAVIGKPFGRIIYFVPGGKKSLLGSFTFFAIALTLLIVYTLMHGTGDVLAPALVVVYAFVLTLAEGLVAGGFDNLTVPVLGAVFLNTL